MRSGFANSDPRESSYYSASDRYSRSTDRYYTNTRASKDVEAQHSDICELVTITEDDASGWPRGPYQCKVKGNSRSEEASVSNVPYVGGEIHVKDEVYVHRWG